LQTWIQCWHSIHQDSEKIQSDASTEAGCPTGQVPGVGLDLTGVLVGTAVTEALKGEADVFIGALVGTPDVPGSS
jgi:hypothetical protein